MDTHTGLTKAYIFLVATAFAGPVGIASGQSGSVTDRINAIPEYNCDQHAATGGNDNNPFVIKLVDLAHDFTGDDINEVAGKIDGDSEAGFGLFDGETGDTLRLFPTIGIAREFAMVIASVGDVDGGGSPDLVLSVMQATKNDPPAPSLLVYSFETGKPISRLILDSVTETSIALTLIDAADADYSGILDAGDIYDVTSDVGAASGNSATDVNGDASVDSVDVVQTAGAVSSPMPLLPQALVLADSLGMTAQGASLSASDSDSASSVFRRIIKWFRRVIDCIDCQYDCADSFTDADACGEQLAEAICDCADEYDILDPQHSACVQDLRENFLQDCVSDVADAAGTCGLCVYQCHPHMHR